MGDGRVCRWECAPSGEEKMEERGAGVQKNRGEKERRREDRDGGAPHSSSTRGAGRDGECVSVSTREVSGVHTVGC